MKQRRFEYEINMTYIQETLFDGEMRKDLGQDQVLTNASDYWKEAAYFTIVKLANDYDEFTSDDLRWMVSAPDHPNAYGAVFSAMAKQKLIRKTGRYVKSKIPSCHSRMIAIWEKYK